MIGHLTALTQRSVISLANKNKQGRQQGEPQLLVSLSSPESNKNKWRGQDKHTPEMHSTLSGRLMKSTLIKMLTQTLWIYERGLTLREKKQLSAGAVLTICQVHSRCTISHRRVRTRPPTHEHSLIKLLFFCLVAAVIFHVAVIVLHFFTTKCN